uniref:Uncharacterized protein n=1 Tax=Phytophthora ramorum TaxID=164328 RepID=H3GBI3_PHYRM
MVSTATSSNLCEPQGHKQNCAIGDKMERQTDTSAGTPADGTRASNSAAEIARATPMAAIVEDPPLELTQRTRAIDRELKPWALYDLSGAKSPGSLEEMTGYFRRFRALRGKSLTGVSHDALQLQ